MGSDFHSGRLEAVPTRLQVKPHDGFTPEAIHPRQDRGLFESDGARTPILAQPPAWMTEQELPCHTNPGKWFERPRGRGATRKAAELCAGCPVLETCLEFALKMEGKSAPEHRFGVWGGTTPAQRYVLSKTRDMLPDLYADKSADGCSDNLSFLLTNDSEETA